MWTLEVTVWTGILYSFCIFQFGDIENLVIFSPQKNSSISPIHTLEKANLSKTFTFFGGWKKNDKNCQLKKINVCERFEMHVIWNVCVGLWMISVMKRFFKKRYYFIN